MRAAASFAVVQLDRHLLEIAPASKAEVLFFRREQEIPQDLLGDHACARCVGAPDVFVEAFKLPGGDVEERPAAQPVYRQCANWEM